MNRTTAAAMAAAALALGPAMAAAAEASGPHGVSANVALTTDYIFRGISQTNENPAIQGGFDYTYKPLGVYAGVWASNIEFNVAGNSNDASIETDWYGGIAGELANGLSWDVGGIYYGYPSQNEDMGADYDYWEVKGTLGYTLGSMPLTPALGVGVYYSPDYFGEDGDSVYVNGSLDLSLPAGFGLGFEVGYIDVDGDKTSGPAGFDYTHYRVGLSKSIAGVDLDLSYHGVSDETDACGGDGICDDRIVFTVSASLDLL